MCHSKMDKIYDVVFAIAVFFLFYSVDFTCSRHIDSMQADGRKCRDDLCIDGDDLDEPYDPDHVDPYVDIPYDDYSDYGDNMAGGFECPYGYRKVSRRGVFFCEPVSETEMPAQPEGPKCAAGQQMVKTETGHLCVPGDVTTVYTDVCPPGLVPKANGDLIDCVVHGDIFNSFGPLEYDPVYDGLGQTVDSIHSDVTSTTYFPDVRFGPEIYGENDAELYYETDTTISHDVTSATDILDARFGPGLQGTNDADDEPSTVVPSDVSDVMSTTYFPDVKFGPGLHGTNDAGVNKESYTVVPGDVNDDRETTDFPDVRFGPGRHGRTDLDNVPDTEVLPESDIKSGKKTPVKSSDKFTYSVVFPGKVISDELQYLECGPGLVPAVLTDRIICTEPVFPTAVCPPDQVPVLSGETLQCAPCPFGKTVVRTEGGLMCDHVTTKIVPTFETVCPDGLVAMETAVGKICQYVPPANLPVSTACTDGQTAKTVDGDVTCVQRVGECPEGQVAIETPEDDIVCGFKGTPTEDTDDNVCPDGMISKDGLCEISDEATGCQGEELPVTSEDGSVTCQTDLIEPSEDVVTLVDGCPPSTILTQTSSGFLCKPSDLPEDRVPMCEHGHVIAKLEEDVYECVSMTLTSLVCNDGEQLTRLGKDFTCMVSRETAPVECGPSEVIALGADGTPRCLDISLAKDVCGPGYKLVPDFESPSGFVCREQDAKIECPDGFSLELHGGKPTCVSDSEPECVDEIGAPTDCHGNIDTAPDLDADLDPALCEHGYHPKMQDDDNVVCVLDATFVEPEVGGATFEDALEPCKEEGCLSMVDFESPNWPPEVDIHDEDLVPGIVEPCIPGFNCPGDDFVGGEHIPDIVEGVDSHSELPLKPCSSVDDVRPCDLDLEVLLAGCNPDCANGGTCVNGSCVCPPGIEGVACQLDVDECANQPNNACAYKCENTFGSFRCDCPSGQLLAEDQRTCTQVGCIPDCLNGGSCHQGNCRCPRGFEGMYCQTDINECEQSQGRMCQYKCRNTYGGYQCICPPGSRVASDDRTCISTTCIPECRNGGLCENKRCTCPAGYYGIICQFDVNECRKHAPCQQTCKNTRGSYVCGCEDGFILNTDRRTCSMI